PTPAGVPVRITVPAGSVAPQQSSAMSARAEKIIFAVVSSCIVSPITPQRIPSDCGSGTCPAGVTCGPSGQKVSKLLPRKNCPPDPDFCHQRALTSFAQQ